MKMGVTAAGSDSAAQGLEHDPRWQLVQRIVASPGFVNSSRLSEVLLYVSRQALVGRGQNLNERSIGEAVFGRSHDYDPRDDNIVRSHASRLRIRLEGYFAGAGADEKIWVVIPRGGYAPVFEEVDTGQAEATVSFPGAAPAAWQPEAPLAPLPLRRRSGNLRLLVAAAGVAAALAGTAAAVVHQRWTAAAQQSPTHKLWAQMFVPDQETLIVPADSSLAIAKIMSGHVTPLLSYAGGGYRQTVDCDKPCDQSLIRDIETHRYTSMTDLEFAVKLTHLREAIPDRTEIRFARDLELKDMKESNLIMIGGQEADPWVSAITGQMTFVIHTNRSEGPPHVENRQPHGGEKSEYAFDPQDPQHRGLATISFLPNLGGKGNLLIVQGFSSPGTQAAADFVTSGRELDALFPAYAGNSARLPHFEILLETVEINGMASRPTPLAWHVYP